jgi:hypothetical protein
VYGRLLQSRSGKEQLTRHHLQEGSSSFYHVSTGPMTFITVVVWMSWSSFDAGVNGVIFTPPAATGVTSLMTPICTRVEIAGSQWGYPQTEVNGTYNLTIGKQNFVSTTHVE